MTPTPRPIASTETDVIGAFKRYGFALVMLPAVLVATIVGGIVHQTILRDFGDVFASGMGGTVSEAFTPESFGLDTTSEEYRHFAQMVQQRIQTGRLTATRVQMLDGTVVYSTNAEEIGQVMPFTREAELAATKGEAASSVVDDHELLSQGAGRNLLITGPVKFGGEPGISGVVTALKPYGTVQPSIRASVLSVVAVVLIGAAVAYGFLYLLVARAQREIAASRERVDHLNKRLATSLTDMERHFIGTLQAFNAAVDAKDRYTARHSLNVADFACALGSRLGMNDEIRSIERAGLLHDVGKIGVAEAVLQKPGNLTAEEYQAVQDHSRIGATMIETVPFLRDIVPAVRAHHEWWDGTGYPDGIAGEAIPKLARVLSVADAFDAMTTTRPYRDAVSIEQAREELVRARGTQFDPLAVDAFVDLIDEGIIAVSDERL